MTAKQERAQRRKDRNEKWRMITHEAYIEGGRACWWCGKYGPIFVDALYGIWGHHKDKRRNNCTKENCYPCHNSCHDEIDHNPEVGRINVSEYPNREAWLRHHQIKEG